MSIIAIEGWEATGKTTLAKWLARVYRRKYVRLPGGCPAAELVRQALREPGLEPNTQAQLHAAAQSATLDTVIKPAMENGQSLVLDRGNLSVEAYQNAGAGLSTSWLDEIYPFIPTTTTILLHYPDWTDAWSNFVRFRDDGDPVERMDASFHQRVHERYSHFAGYYQKFPYDNTVHVIELPLSLERVREDAVDFLSDIGLVPELEARTLRS